MFEYIMQTMLSVNLFGLGAFITLFSLSVGISYLVSNGQMKTFLISMIIINYTISIGIFMLNRESFYGLLTTAVLILIIVLPDGTLDFVFDKVRGRNDE